MYCKLVKKEFNTKKEMFSYIKENKENIVKSLKSQVKTKSVNIFGFYNPTNLTVKNIPNLDEKYFYPIISNTNFLDSHNDVHLDGSMNKTAKEQQGKVCYTTDHEIKINNIVAYPEDVEMLIENLDFSQLTKEYTGKTECLMFKIPKTEIINASFKKSQEKGKKLQNSIRMIYVKIDIGFNDNDPEFAQEKQYYDEAYQKCVNKQDFKGVDVVTLVRELKIHMEGSAVPFASNPITHIESKEAVSNDTSNIEPSDDTQNIATMLQKVKFNFNH